MLYPVDSEFGFYVTDFVGAVEKPRDNDYGEGYAGNLPDGSGVAIANAVTDRYKVKPPQGTWCQGLGGNSVKCSTEHYTVMEHVLSCHEVIPYFFADPTLGPPAVQGVLSTPDDPPSLSVDCATTALDDDLQILIGGLPVGGRLTDADPCLAKDPNDPTNCQMLPNDNTSVLDDLAVSTDYSVTLKDDGKALYRWGALIKRPNDMRLYARLELPDEWKAPGADFKVTKAHLVINHTITNNPNDQVRPEDLENEAAIGVLPDHEISADGEVWKSTKLCYEGDGDLIDNELGAGDPSAIGVGTYYKNGPFALDPTATPGDQPADPPYAFSEDLTEALTNAWYTTIDREPFEWSYEVVTTNADGSKIVDYRGCPGPVEEYGCANVPAGAPLFSGPRWRLKPNKFGQDLPGLEIPTTAALEENCTPPPFSKDLIKYEVGAPTTTVLNLLDWDDAEGPPPLATSKGWVDSANNNPYIEIVDTVVDDNGDLREITSIGAPMSDDFDVMIYVKGDRKPVFIYDAKLVLEYEGETPTEPDEADLRLGNLTVPLKVSGQTPSSRIKELYVTACNDGPDVVDGFINLDGVSLVDGVAPVNYTAQFEALAGCTTATFSWTAPSVGTAINWTAEVQPVTGVVDPNPSNNTATGQTVVYPLRK